MVMGPLLEAVQATLFSAEVWRLILAAALFGTLVGMIPGLTASMAIALFVPIAYWLSPVAAVTGIVTIVACAIFSGDIPSVMVRIPGTPASAAYAQEAYALGRVRGTSHVLVVMLVFSVVGGLLGTGVLIALSPQLARIATTFSVAEYFWLYLAGVSCAVLIGGRSIATAGIALLIGLLLSMVGLSAVHGVTRLTFGRPELAQGINFVPAMIGLFGM
jgi:TctA family transporter